MTIYQKISMVHLYNFYQSFVYKINYSKNTFNAITKKIVLMLIEPFIIITINSTLLLWEIV